MTPLKPHEWEYFQKRGKGKSEAVCIPNGYMVHPDREELFIAAPRIDVDNDFLVRGKVEPKPSKLKGKLIRWGSSEPGFFDKMKDLIHKHRHYIPFLKV